MSVSAEERRGEDSYLGGHAVTQVHDGSVVRVGPLVQTEVPSQTVLHLQKTRPEGGAGEQHGRKRKADIEKRRKDRDTTSALQAGAN